MKIARQQGDKSVGGCDCFLATLSVSIYTEQSSFPVGIFLQKQSILVFASLPTLLVAMEWPSFLRQNQGNATSGFNCLC